MMTVYGTIIYKRNRVLGQSLSFLARPWYKLKLLLFDEPVTSHDIVSF